MSSQDTPAAPKENWDDAGLISPDEHEVVKAIHLIAYINRENVHTKKELSPANHWFSFLEIEGGRSVRVNMIFVGKGRVGKLEVISKKYPVSESAIKTFTITPKPGVTVQDILDLIMAKKRQNYMFTEIREGCRYWNQVHFEDLEEAGYVDKGVAAKVREEGLSFYWHNPEGQVEREIAKGEFY